MAYTATDLRNDIYKILDRVIETGVPAEVERQGHLLRIVPVEPRDALQSVPSLDDLISGDPTDLEHIDWSSEWKP
jgi:prevent-host-death family protein